MGRTDVTNYEKVKNPVKRYIKFSGETGVFSYWDSEKKQNVALESLDLVLLDRRASVSGWSDANNSSIYSNFFNSTKDAITVRAGDKDIIAGTWEANKDAIKEAGGEYCENLFALADIDGEWELVALKLTKSALSSWSNFTTENKVKMSALYNSLLVVEKGPQQKKGRILYVMPTFRTEALPADLAKLADEAHRNELKPYLERSTKKEETVTA